MTSSFPGNILWIDDDVRREDAIVKLLEAEGFRINVAASGKQGLTEAQAHCFDAILLDLKLDDMYGLTVLQRLTAAHVTVPVVVLTGCYGEPEVEDEVLRQGAVAFRLKPLDGEDLSRVLQIVIRSDPMGRVAKPGRHGSMNPRGGLSTSGDEQLIDPRVSEVLRILRQDLGAQQSLQELAQQVGLDESRLRHLVSMVPHMPLSQFRKRLRLDKAAELLVTTHRRVSEIASQMAMDPVYFAKSFHKRFGMSPREYRVQHQRTPRRASPQV